VIDGSFAEMKVTCGKSNCKCASGEKHTSYKLVKKIQGRSKTTHIPRELVEEVKNIGSGKSPHQSSNEGDCLAKRADHR